MPRRKKSSRPTRRPKVSKRLRTWLGRVVLLLVIAEAAYLYFIWPDWQVLKQGPVPKSRFIMNYEDRLRMMGKSSDLQWNPVPYTQISPLLRKAVIVAEDSRFYQHNGIDLEAVRSAVEYNLAHNEVILGASTISQQTVKNMFLTTSRDPLRKWHELVLTLAMELYLTKQRILEIYLNVAEFGKGIYGAQAAAQHYWGISVSKVNYTQAIKLAATLPSPKTHNPATRTEQFMRRFNKINRHMAAVDRKGTPLPR